MKKKEVSEILLGNYLISIFMVAPYLQLKIPSNLLWSQCICLHSNDFAALKVWGGRTAKNKYHREDQRLLMVFFLNTRPKESWKEICSFSS